MRPPHRRPPACTDDVRPSPAQYGEGLGAAFATELTARGRAGRTARVAADGGDREAARRAVGVSDYHVEPAADGEEHSAEVSALACEVIREELEKRAEMRGQGTSCGKGTITEGTMGKADREYLMGRGPPCAICAHVCHHSFIQLAGVSDRTTRGGAALTSGAARRLVTPCSARWGATQALATAARRR